MIFFFNFKREFCIIYRKEVYNGALDLATTFNPKKDETTKEWSYKNKINKMQTKNFGFFLDM